MAFGDSVLPSDMARGTPLADMLRGVLRNEISTIKSSCLIRIWQLQGQLEVIKKRVEDPDYPLNDMGELQGMTSILDCRLATLGTLRRVALKYPPKKG